MLSCIFTIRSVNSGTATDIGRVFDLLRLYFFSSYFVIIYRDDLCRVLLLLQPTYTNSTTTEKIVTKSYAGNQSSANAGSMGRAGLRPANNNLSELDILLQDLSSARYGDKSKYKG